MRRMTALLLCLVLLAGCRRTGPDLPDTQTGPGMALSWQSVPLPEGEEVVYGLLTDDALYYQTSQGDPDTGIWESRLYRCPYAGEPRLLYSCDTLSLRFTPAGEGAWIGENREKGKMSLLTVWVKQIGPDGALLREAALPEGTDWLSNMALSADGILCLTVGNTLFRSGEDPETFESISLPEGMRGDLYPLKDGRLLGFVTGEEGEQAVIFDPAAGALSDPFSLGREEGSLYLSVGECDLMNLTSAGILQTGDSRGEWTDLLDLNDWELAPWKNGGQYADVRLLADEEVLLLERDTKEWRICRLTPCAGAEATPALTLAGYGMGTLRGYVRAYNRSQSDRIIRVKDYSAGGTSGFTALNTALMAGDRPDLLCTDGFVSARALIARHAFLDLTDYIQQDFGADWFVEGALEKYTLAGGIWQLSPCFHLDCMIGNSDLLGEDCALTFERMEQLRQGYPDIPLFFSEFMQEKMMTHMESACVGDFVDWESGACDFQNKHFTDMLELAASLPTMDQVMDSWNDGGEIISSTESLARGLILLSQVDMNGLWQYHRMQRMLQSRTVYPGFPNARGDGNVFCGVSKVGIMAGCADPEGAWDFLCWLVRTYSEELDVTDMYAYFPMGGEAFARFAAYYQSGEVEDPLTDTDVARLYDLVRRTRPSTDYDEQITAVIEEEAAKYFQEKCTVEEAAAAVQSRVSLYISEQS